MIKGSNRYRAVIKERHPVKDIANINRFSVKLDASPSKQQIITALKSGHTKIIPREDSD